MNTKLQVRLITKHPFLYHRIWLSKAESCLYWGITCGNGWYPIIEDLSNKLDEYNHYADHKHMVMVEQIKEKFGRLAFYVRKEDVPDPEYVLPSFIQEWLNEANELSGHTCEKCGETNRYIKSGYGPGKRKDACCGGWKRTLCGTCWNKHFSRKSWKKDPDNPHPDDVRKLLKLGLEHAEI